MRLVCVVLLVGFSESIDVAKSLLRKENSKRGCFLGLCDDSEKDSDKEDPGSSGAPLSTETSAKEEEDVKQLAAVPEEAKQLESDTSSVEAENEQVLGAEKHPEEERHVEEVGKGDTKWEMKWDTIPGESEEDRGKRLMKDALAHMADKIKDKMKEISSRMPGGNKDSASDTLANLWKPKSAKSAPLPHQKSAGLPLF